MTCLQEDCANWDGHGCPCRVLDLEPVDVRASFYDDWDDEDGNCQHEWELRSEHDTWVCAWCQAETTSPSVIPTSPAQPAPSPCEHGRRFCEECHGGDVL